MNSAHSKATGIKALRMAKKVKIAMMDEMIATAEVNEKATLITARAAFVAMSDMEFFRYMTGR